VARFVCPRLFVVCTCSSAADAKLKGYLETQADCVYTVEHSPSALEDLRSIGGLAKPSTSVILVLEAVIVLMSPKHAFSGPNPAVFGASWAASHRLLFLPPAELAHRMRSVDASAVPPHNIDALLKYLAHPDWPLPGGPVSNSRHLGRIAEWVNAVVQYNQLVLSWCRPFLCVLMGAFNVQLLASEGGLPESLTKNDGIFSAVILVKDGTMLKDTGESRLAPPVPHPLSTYDSKELAYVAVVGRSNENLRGDEFSPTVLRVVLWLQPRCQ
jgi:hypothetical protein